MEFFEYFKPMITQIHQQLMDSVVPDLPLSLKNPIVYFLETPGKKIRPLLTLLSCQVLGGERREALPGAIAVELFHDFTLIHDDIMDRDELRRGKPTIHVKWDDGTAILVGDALIGLAYQQLLKLPSHCLIPVVTIFSEALVKVCEGQALDKEFERRPDVGLDEYLEMVGKKTAWLLKTSCELGGVIAQGRPEEIKALGDFGYYIGIGFQIQDDLLDVIADEDKLGKKIGSDFRREKKTYLTLKYREAMRQQQSSSSVNRPLNLDEFATFAQLREAVLEMGLAESVSRDADAFIEKGLDALKQVGPLNPQNPLYMLTEFLRKRQF